MNLAHSFTPAYAPRERQLPPARPLHATPSTPAQRLLEQLTPDTQLTGLGIAVLRIVRLSERGDGAVHELSHALLADPFIAQKVVRFANIVADQRGTAPVTTLSRAVVLLGLDQIRAIAGSTALVDHLQDRKQAARVQEEFAQSLYATTLARELAGARPGVDPEEAALCTMFRNFGRLMAAIYLHQPYEDALAMARAEQISEGQAAARTMGMGFDRLGIEVLNRWRLPERIAQAALPCPASIRPSSSAHVTLRILAEFCTEIAEAVREPNLLSRRHRIESLLERFGDGLGLQRKRLKQALREADEHARELGESLGIFGTGAAGDCLEDANVLALSPTQRPGVSLTLSAGVASIARMLERHQAPEAMFTHAVEVLRRAFDFQRVVLCGKDAHTHEYLVYRMAGKALNTPQDDFSFVEMCGQDLFTAALIKNADVYIRETSDPRLQKALPAWFHDACPDSRSFLLLPLNAQGAAIGFIYADYAQSNVRRLGAEEVELLKTLKTQMAIALHQSQSLSEATPI